MRLTWADLIVGDIASDDVQRWLAPWASRVGGMVAPAFMNKFGTWFLRRPEGRVEMLDVFTGELTEISDSYERFVAEVNQPWWQVAYLVSEFVYELHQQGKIPGHNECYALVPHPALGGPNPFADEAIDPRWVMIMDIAVWQDICAQSVLHRGGERQK